MVMAWADDRDMSVDWSGKRGRLRWSWLLWAIGALAWLMPALAATREGVPIVVERYVTAIGDDDLAALQRGALDARLQAEDPAAVTPPVGRTTWYRVQLVAEWVSPREPVLLITYANDMRVRAYGPPSYGGDEYSIYRADIGTLRTRRVLVVPLPQGWNAGTPLYLRVEAATAVTHQFIVTDRQSAYAAELTQARLDVLWPLLQLSLLLAGLVVLRPRSNNLGALYLGLTAAIAVAMACKSGLAFEYWPTRLLAPLGVRATALAATTVALFALALARAYLELPRWAPRLARGFIGCGGVLVAFVIACTLPLPDAWMMRITSALVGTALTLSWLAGVRAWRHRRPGAALFVLVWSPTLAVILLRMVYVLLQQPSPPLAGPLQAAALSVAALGMLHLLSQRLPRDAVASYGDVRHERDVLTGALSRGAGLARLRASFVAARTRQRPLSLISCDLGPHLRERRNGCARSEVDASLCALMAVLRAELRRNDGIVRAGDERLLAIASEADAGAARALAERIVRHIDAAALDLCGAPLASVLALGVASLGEDVRTPEEMLDRALADGEARRGSHAAAAARSAAPPRRA